MEHHNGTHYKSARYENTNNIPLDIACFSVLTLTKLQYQKTTLVLFVPLIAKWISDALNDSYHGDD